MSKNGLFSIVFSIVVCTANAQTLTMQPAVKPVAKSAVKSSAYLTHTVKTGENLYQISKLYSVSVNDILLANPGLTESVVKLGQIIRVPNHQHKKILTNSETKANELKPKVAPKVELVPKNKKYHTVEAGQTMYAISKLYNVKIEDIQKWNNIKDFNLELGSQIIISDEKEVLKPIIKNEIIKQEIKEKIKEVDTSNKIVETPQNTPTIEENVVTETQTPDIQASNNATQKDLAKIYKEKAKTADMQVAKGTGAPITTTLGTIETVYLVLHKWLPIGTVIKVKNLVNSKIVYAKVIGKLEDNIKNTHVIIRYSLGVKKDLLLNDGKCYLQIEYPN